jgi:hypothetical protein
MSYKKYLPKDITNNKRGCTYQGTASLVIGGLLKLPKSQMIRIKTFLDAGYL